MKYIGVKIIEAMAMGVMEAKERGYKTSDSGPGSTGYEITYPDGYKSWCPEEVFIDAYFPLMDPEGSKIMSEDVDFMMGPLTSEQISPKSTLIKAEHSRIGFDTYNVSSCVDPANYDEKLGLKYGSEQIKSEFWQCLGFVLQWAKNGLGGKKVLDAKPESNYQQRVLQERDELSEKIEKLETFRQLDTFKSLPDIERKLLTEQLDSMIKYISVLAERIKLF